MSTVYTKKEIDLLRESGRRLASVLGLVARHAVAGTTTKELDDLAERLIRDGGDEPAFLKYQPTGAPYPFPASLCVSINDEIVHGIPSESRVLKDGDIVGLDLGVKHKGLITDMAVTVAVGDIGEEKKKLMEATKKALDAGIAAAGAGTRVGDVAHAIESVAHEYGFKVADGLGGHGVGHVVHEPPFIPNEGKPHTGPKLKENQVLALEPIFCVGGKAVVLDKDGYTYKTVNGAPSAHFEHTILVTKDCGKVLTSN